MKYNFEYWEDAYFYGWLGKLIIVAFVVFFFYELKYELEPWVVETLCKKFIRCE